MRRILLLLFTSFLATFSSEAQLTRHLVYLKNKGATTHTLSNPSTYLSQRAIDRRTRYNIAIDSTDLPVPASYLSQIAAVPGVTILNVSRWLNAVAIDTSDANALAAIHALPFVKESTPLAARSSAATAGKFGEDPDLLLPTARPQGMEADYFDYGNGSLDEVKVHHGDFLHNIGLRGQGMHLAMLDAGFFHYTTLDAFDSVVADGRVLSTWDFVNREPSVVEDHSHGMMCFSTIAANIPGIFIGKAPYASFHLFRTEDVFSEYPIEEFNFVCGAERADSTGSDIISCSLGYNTFDDPSLNHTYADMDGNTVISTIGADLAAKKGLLVFNAIGNYGNDPWKFLTSPSDGDSVIAVGAVNTDSVVWSGSSYGPSPDGRVKPDVASVGLLALVQGGGNTVGVGTGTSFACPNMAGMGACLWQGFPEFNNMRIVRAIREAGSIYTSPNTRIGYGIPDMKKAFTTLLIEYAESSISINACSASLQWNSKDVRAMRYEVERKLPGEMNFSKIATIDPQAGDVLANRSYSFSNDLANVPAGTVSYRVRQIVDTAAASFTAVYIDTAELTLPNGCIPTSIDNPDPDADRVTLLPNPAKEMTALVVETRNAISDLRILVYDMNGKRMMERRESKGPGKKTISISLEKLAAGRYQVVVYDKGRMVGSVELLRG